MKTRTLMAAALAATAFGAFADFEINLDLAAKPIRDHEKNRCSPVIGYAGALTDLNGDMSDDVVFISNKVQTAKLCRAAGAWYQRVWSANSWWYRSTPQYLEELKAKGKLHKKSRTNPKAAFEFWKQNGIKVSFTLEQWGWHKGDRTTVDFVKWIVDNGYQDVVADFELGNETYFAPISQQQRIAANWTEIVPEIRKLMPTVPLGIPIAEYFENDPDVAQIRKRLLEDKDPIVRTNYFSVTQSSRNSAAFLVAMSNALPQVTHVIYHCYGGETPYSCSYHGYKRYRNLAEAFPVLKKMKWLLTEVRVRSDEDDRCQRMFRESLWLGHYFLTSLAQPEIDGINYHNIMALSGALYIARGSGLKWNYRVQWRDGGGEYPDYGTVYGIPNHDIGSAANVFRYYTEAIKQYPRVLAHGTSKARDVEKCFYACSELMDQVYARRRALKEGRRGADVPKVDGEVEWLATSGPNGVCLLMVNTKSTAERFTVSVKDRILAAPNYRTMSCDEKFLDCREIPGDPKPWRTVSWEDTCQGFESVSMDRYVGMKPKCDSLELEIAPHTVQTVSFCVRNKPQPKPEKK